MRHPVILWVMVMLALHGNLSSHEIPETCLGCGELELHEGVCLRWAERREVGLDFMNSLNASHTNMRGVDGVDPRRLAALAVILDCPDSFRSFVLPQTSIPNLRAWEQFRSSILFSGHGKTWAENGYLHCLVSLEIVGQWDCIYVGPLTLDASTEQHRHFNAGLACPTNDWKDVSTCRLLVDLTSSAFAPPSLESSSSSSSTAASSSETPTFGFSDALFIVMLVMSVIWAVACIIG